MMLSRWSCRLPQPLPLSLSFCFSGADLPQESGQIRINQGRPFREQGRR